jgi:sialate O-acetylesterase
MKNRQFLILLVLFVGTRLFAVDTAALPFLSPVFGDHMVIQRGKPNRIWGWTKPGSEVRVEIEGRKATAMAAPDGRWQTQFDPPAAGGPYILKIDGPQQIELHDVLVGDVWLCGGQSNMAFGLTESRNGAAVVKAANTPGIRLFRVGQKASYGPTSMPQGKWRLCTPETFSSESGFSAVAFYFGRKIYAVTGVPIGLIQDAVGGTPAETWMNPDTLRKMPDFTAALAEISRLKAHGGVEYGNYISHWYDEFDRGQPENWNAESFNDTAWKPTTLKSGFADLGVPETPTVCWFRNEIVLPDPLPAGTSKIFLGVVEKMDTTYINGHWVGASSWVENPRIYALNTGILRPGRNLIAIRVFKLKPNGGFQSSAATLRLVLGDGTTIPLADSWKGALSVDARPPHPLPLGYENYPTMPSVLFQGMIRPLAPLAITGAIWYQGEANQFNVPQYRTLLPAMIADWRALFAQGDFPFYIVSLPAFTARRNEPGTDGWTQIREVQAHTAREVPNSGLAVTVDTGDADNIHPTDKQPVGERLALLALKNTYARDVVCSGPTFSRLEQQPGVLRIHFLNIDGGLTANGEKLGEFSIAGTDQVWHWAEARIERDTVVVSSPQVANPVAVRYAWQANPLATLYNGAGLPAAPFRTDDW